jgi:hypothetical protein
VGCNARPGSARRENAYESGWSLARYSCPLVRAAEGPPMSCRWAAWLLRGDDMGLRFLASSADTAYASGLSIPFQWTLDRADFPSKAPPWEGPCQSRRVRLFWNDALPLVFKREGPWEAVPGWEILWATAVGRS